MSNSTDKTGCISHRANSRFFVMYEDFLEVAKVSEHQHKLAAFWRVLETKTNDRITYNQEIIEDAKKKGLPEPKIDLWVEIPYSECVNRSLGSYKSSAFQIAAAESERLGFSESRVLKRPRNPLDPNSPLEDYKEYRFLTDVMQSVLNGGEYPTPIEINSTLLKSLATRKERRAIEKNTSAIENNGTPGIENNGTAIDFNRKKNREESSKKNKKEESTRVASATSAHALSDNDTSQQGGDRAHETDAALPDVPALDALGLHGGVETVAAPAAFQEPLAQKGDTDATSTLPDPDPVHAPTATGNHLHRVEDRRAPVQAEAPVTLLSQTPFPVTSPQTARSGLVQGPAGRARRGKAQQQDVTQALSLQGAQVKEWMEEIKGRKRRMTEKNIQAWNTLAEEDEIGLENLREVIAKWEKNQWVKEHNYVIDEHVLTQDGGKFTFANGMELVRRERKSKEPPVTAGHTVSGYQYYVKPKSAKVVVV